MKQLSSTIGSLGIGGVVVGALLFMHWAATVLVPMLLALYFTALALPLYRWLVSKRIPQPVCLILIAAIVLVVAAALLALGYVSVTRLRDGLETYDTEIDAHMPDLQEHLRTARVPGELREQLSSERLSSALRFTVDVVAGAVGTLIFSVVLTAMLLLEARRFSELMDQGFSSRPVFAQAPAVARAAITYFGVRIQINLLTALTATVVLLILGVDYALLWGAGVFFLSFIPYIGLIVALIPPTILAYAEYGVGRALVVVVTAVVINLAIENILAPAMTSRALRLSQGVVFASFFFWAAGIRSRRIPFAGCCRTASISANFLMGKEVGPKGGMPRLLTVHSSTRSRKHASSGGGRRRRCVAVRACSPSHRCCAAAPAGGECG